MAVKKKVAKKIAKNFYVLNEYDENCCGAYFATKAEAVAEAKKHLATDAENGSVDGIQYTVHQRLAVVAGKAVEVTTTVTDL